MRESPFWVDRSGTAYVVVRATAVVDARTAATLRDTVRALLRGGRYFLALDLTASAVYGPQGFSMVLAVVRACRERGGQVYLIGASATARQILGYGPRGPGRAFRDRGELDGFLLSRPADREVRRG